MNRTGRALTLGCLLLLLPLLANAGGNSLLIPATGRCNLNSLPENLSEAVAACQQAAKGGDAQAQYELGEFYYDGKRVPRDLKETLRVPPAHLHLLRRHTQRTPDQHRRRRRQRPRLAGRVIHHLAKPK